MEEETQDAEAQHRIWEVVDVESGDTIQLPPENPDDHMVNGLSWTALWAEIHKEPDPSEVDSRNLQGKDVKYLPWQYFCNHLNRLFGFHGSGWFLDTLSIDDKKGANSWQPEGDYRLRIPAIGFEWTARATATNPTHAYGIEAARSFGLKTCAKHIGPLFGLFVDDVGADGKQDQVEPESDVDVQRGRDRRPVIDSEQKELVSIVTTLVTEHDCDDLLVGKKTGEPLNIETLAVASLKRLIKAIEERPVRTANEPPAEPPTESEVEPQPEPDQQAPPPEPQPEPTSAPPPTVENERPWDAYDEAQCREHIQVMREAIGDTETVVKYNDTAVYDFLTQDLAKWDIEYLQWIIGAVYELHDGLQDAMARDSELAAQSV